MSYSKIGGNLLGGFTMGMGGGGGGVTKGIHKVLCFRHPGGIMINSSPRIQCVLFID